MNNYALNKLTDTREKTGMLKAIGRFLPFMTKEKKWFIFGAIAILVNSGLTLTAPFLIGHTIDTYIQAKQYQGVFIFSGILLAMYLVILVANYAQTRIMGSIGQRVLFNLRDKIFTKIQELPVAFFNQNQAGDLISRINNDTDKLNQAFSQYLMQFIGGVFILFGSAIFILVLDFKLALTALIPAAIILIFTQIISPKVKQKNAINLKSVGGMSAEIQESLDNFKVIVAYNRRDYFRQKFDAANKKNYSTATSAGLFNNIFSPVYGLAANIAQLIVLAYGIHLILAGHFTVGLLISFLAYINNFYLPLQQIAAIWSAFQTALASWDRIYAILSLESDLIIIPDDSVKKSGNILEFQDVSFGYIENKDILENINLKLESKKTYALVGPTGGGKTTTASLMARLYDPTKGKILLDGKDIRSYNPAERAKKIGFILQEPFLFTGTVKENILYGNTEYQDLSDEDLNKILTAADLEDLLIRFESGLDTKISAGGDTISLGQKQLIAFIRAVLRKPEILILDEATANIDTITEQLLGEILNKLPEETTKVIIAHRLNTIQNADEIFFVNAGKVTLAGSMEHALEMLLHNKRES